MLFKNFIVVLLCCSATSLFGQDLSPCEGTVVQRRFALIQLGKIADTYIKKNGTLPNLCPNEGEFLAKNTPDVLRSALICGSSKEERIFYNCILKNETANKGPVIESCTYALDGKPLTCENKFVATIIEEE